MKLKNIIIETTK